MSTNIVSTATLQALYAVFSSNIKYNSLSVVADNNKPAIIPLSSFIGNPDYSAFNSKPGSASTIYNGLISNLGQFINDVQNNNTGNGDLGNITLRVQVIMPDGNVFFDSAKNNQNTYANFLSKSINENHGTRHYIQQAIHSKNGVGWEVKWSSSVKGIQTYYAVRFGMSEHTSLGVLVLSYDKSF